MDEKIPNPDVSKNGGLTVFIPGDSVSIKCSSIAEGTEVRLKIMILCCYDDKNELVAKFNGHLGYRWND